MAKQEGHHFRFMKLEFFAQRGMVTIIDLEAAGDSDVAADEAIQRVSPGEFMKRVVAVRMGTGDKYPDEIRTVNNFMDQAVACAKLAKAQGDPTDAKVWEHHAKHTRRSSILMPGDVGTGTVMSPSEVNGRLGPVGGQKFKLRLGKPRDMLKNGVDVVPDLRVRASDMLTPQRAETLRKKKRVRS